MSSSMNTSIISSTNGGSPHIAASSRSRVTSASLTCRSAGPPRRAAPRPAPSATAASRAAGCSRSSAVRRPGRHRGGHRLQPRRSRPPAPPADRDLGVVEQPEHPRAERRHVGARHLDVDRAVGAARARRGPRRARARRRRRAAGVDAHASRPRPSPGAPSSFGSLGNAARRSKSGRPLERRVLADRRRRPRSGRPGTSAARRARGRARRRTRTRSRSSSPYGSSRRSLPR